MGQVETSTRAKPILVDNDKGGFRLLLNNLKSILLAEDVINKPVVVISVLDACRKGKPILDMMVRHLTASDKSNWVEEQSIEQFLRQRTTGILMWSEPLPVTLPSGEEAVIVLMNTHGPIDDQSPVLEPYPMFALSTLLSSLQIVDVENNVDDDYLKQLELFIEYGRMMLDGNSTKPFEKLLFLVQNWGNVHVFPLGSAGGDKLVTEWLQNDSGNKEHAKVREHIRDCFSQINGFLLPHPDTAFATRLEELMPKILAPDNLTIKTVAGVPIKARDLYVFFQSYASLFQTATLPKPENILQATAEASNKSAVQEAKAQYIKEMECLVQDDQPSVDYDKLFVNHREATVMAEKVFNDQKKMGDEKMSQEYLKILVQETEEWFRVAIQTNSIKRIMELIDTCRRTYVSKMEPIVRETAGFVPQKNITSAHNVAKEVAMNKFDAGSRGYSVAWDSRFKLAQLIGVHYRLIRLNNGVKETAEKRQAAHASMKAVELAHRSYQTVMNATTARCERTEELERHHQAALQAALDVFESSKEGEEHITVGYLQSLKNLIDESHEMDTYRLADNKKRR